MPNKPKETIINSIFCLSILFAVFQPQIFSANPIGPSFECTGELTPVERMICESPYTAKYDLVMAEMYKMLMDHLPQEKKSKLKDDQVNWLKNTRKAAFEEEQDIRKNKTFAHSERGYADRLVLAYGRRMEALVQRYDNEFQDILFLKLDDISSQEELSNSLRLVFCAWFFFHEKIADPDSGFEKTSGVYDLDDESHLLIQKDGTWLLVWRGNPYFSITNNDGGVYGFKLIFPKERKIALIPIKGDLSSLHIAQGYIAEIREDKIILANGGYRENVDGSHGEPNELKAYVLQADPNHIIKVEIVKKA